MMSIVVEINDRNIVKITVSFKLFTETTKLYCFYSIKNVAGTMNYKTKNFAKLDMKMEELQWIKVKVVS